jgi:Fe-S cluster biosynthesis and repair protein YggX
MKYPPITCQLLLDKNVSDNNIDEFRNLFGTNGMMRLDETTFIRYSKNFSWGYLGNCLLDEPDKKLFNEITKHYWERWYENHIRLYNTYKGISDSDSIKKTGIRPTQQDFYNYILPNNEEREKTCKAEALGFYYIYTRN